MPTPVVAHRRPRDEGPQTFYSPRSNERTAYEPDLLLRLEAVKADRKKSVVMTAHVEKVHTRTSHPCPHSRRPFGK
jgi:hypothetical protein